MAGTRRLANLLAFLLLFSTLSAAWPWPLWDRSTALVSLMPRQENQEATATATTDAAADKADDEVVADEADAVVTTEKADDEEATTNANDEEATTNANDEEATTNTNDEEATTNEKDEEVTTNEDDEAATTNEDDEEAAADDADKATTTADADEAATTDADDADADDDDDDKATTTDDSATTTGKSSSTKTSSKAKTTTAIDPRLPPGGVAMISPAITEGAQYYKVGDYVTFEWNYTSLSVTPSAIDVLASCSLNSATYTIAANMSVSETGRVIWDTGNTATLSNPYPVATYTLVIHDAAKEPTDVASAGYLGAYNQYTFGMYTGQPYVKLDQYQCATCNGALSMHERQLLGVVGFTALVTLFSFTWFANGFGLLH
ncbi:hypothetical protein DV738_g4559, partial [Chaetothyriales sp. CBS 135597]